MQKHSLARKLKMSSTLGNIEDMAKEKLESIRGGVRFTKRAVRSVDRYSHKNPWMVVGAFTVIGWLFGFFMRRSSNPE